MTTPDHSPLGRETTYPRQYDARLLFPIPRSAQREILGFSDGLPFHGEDIWTAYELSWLDARGRPQVAIATFRLPADSPCIIESKSLKLYLNGFAFEKFPTVDDLRAIIARDLSHASGATVEVVIDAAAAMSRMTAFAELEGECIDGLEVSLAPVADIDPSSLAAAATEAAHEELLVSRLFRSNCPVTGQPDWADVQVRARGVAIDRAGLLRYLVSFRQHQGFHEHCVERIFSDVLRYCAPAALTVYARFTRRGGLDINPWRSNDAHFPAPANIRTPRQ
jgi:7-cyano-7-deazaguanine reductase